MPPNTKATEAEAQQRHEAVKMFRAGHTAPSIATAFHRSRRWVYYWVAYQRQHPHSRLRSASRAPRHQPNQISRQTTYRIVRLRQTLARPPLAPSPNAVQATDIVPRWLPGGEVVQTFTTVAHCPNTASATPQPHKRATA